MPPMPPGSWSRACPGRDPGAGLEPPGCFRCAHCGEMQFLDTLCAEASSVVLLRCQHCCGCEVHGSVDDPGGRVVLDFRRAHPWRGIGSAWCMRRHR